MESRRDALKMMLVTAAAAMGGKAAVAQASTVDGSMGVDAAKRTLSLRAGADGQLEFTQAEAVEADAPPEVVPQALINPLRNGDVLGGTWKLASLGAIAAGAVVLELHDFEGQRARVHICKRDGDALGLASTPRLDIVLMNGGDGSKTSSEFLGRVVLGLAALLEQNEDAAFAAHPELANLMTHDERLRAFHGTAALS